MFQEYRENALSDAEYEELSAQGCLFKDFFNEYITVNPDSFVVRESVMNAFVNWRQTKKKQIVMKFTELDQGANDINDSFEPSQFKTVVETDRLSDVQQSGEMGCNVF